MSYDHIVILGYRGSGKSTLGRRLASCLGLPFVDLDARIEEREGSNVAEIFAAQGEAHFRAVESRLLQEVLAGPPAVVAPGGGVVLDRNNRRLLRACSRRVYLCVAPAELDRRLADAPGRPPLTDLTARVETEQLARQRDPLYRKLATDVIVVADGEQEEQSLAKVRRKLESPLE